jgi:hypothetical protein
MRLRATGSEECRPTVPSPQRTQQSRLAQLHRAVIASVNGEASSREGILDRRVQGVAAACGEDGRDCSGEIRFVAGVRSSPAGDALKHLHRCVDCRRTACCSCAGLPEAGLDPVDFIRARTRVAGCAVPPAVAAVWN